MAGWSTLEGGGLPARFQVPTFFEPHQDRIESARRQAQLLTQLVSVDPITAGPDECVEDADCLGGRFSGHNSTNSTYVELVTGKKLSSLRRRDAAIQPESRNPRSSGL